MITASRTLAIAALAACTSMASAQTITPGFTFSVASAGNAPATGTHYHSNTGGAFGNPAGKAEVGSFSSEECRGLSEYNLATLTPATSAFVTFDVYRAGGLFNGVNNFPFIGDINIFAYQGNNTEDISDYHAASTGFIGTFNTSGLVVGSVLSFDITSIFNQAIADNWISLGIRLQIAPGTNTGGGAWTFQDFRLTANNQTNIIPTPTAALAGASTLIGLGALGGLRRRRR